MFKEDTLLRDNIKLISSKYLLLSVGPNTCLWYRKGKIWISKDTNNIKKSKACDLYDAFGYSLFYRLLINISMVQRILRLQPRSCVKDGNDNYCFSFNKRLFIVDEYGELLSSYPVGNNMRNPLKITYIHDIEGFDNGFVYGEYGWNTNRSKVNILRYDGNAWINVFTFPEKTICHIHALIPDVQNKCVYILTGDNDHESGIWKATNNFRDVTPIVVGSQRYRSCAAILRDSNIIYGTDTPLEANGLLSINLKNNNCIKKIIDLPGSVINALEINDTWWFATAVEQDPNLPFILHCFSSRIGPGIKDRFSHIFKFSSDGHVEEMFCLKKDIFPMWLFQFGNLFFVNNYRDNRVFAVPIALKKYSLKTIEIIST